MNYRNLTILLIAVAGLFLGARIGIVVSYWVVDPIMRMYLTLGEYLAKLPYLSVGGLLNIWRDIFLCQLAGAIIGCLPAVLLHFYWRKRK